MDKREKIDYTSIYTGKRETYELSHNESLTGVKCPIDGTVLVSFEGSSGRDVWETKTMYDCPNCGINYYHLEPEKLEHSKQITIQERKKRLAELRLNESRIVSLLKAAGEKDV